MRYLRLIFLALLALVLLTLAMANRQMVTLNLFPANFDQYLGGDLSADLPLFLVIFLAIAFGMVAGLVWEYLREAHIRREAQLRRAEVDRLSREVENGPSARPAARDEVLAILDRPRPATATHNPSDPLPIASPEPARGTTLPAR